jgi:hypothetical protein
MKISGKSVCPPTPVKVTIYRDSGNYEFLCGPILDYSKFSAICPVPKPPLIMDRLKGNRPDVADKNYLLRLDQHNDLRVAWLIITSLNFTPNLEWELVKIDEPDTWMKYEEELKQSLTDSEYNRLISCVFEANSPTEQRRKEALNSFTPSQVEALTPSNSQPGEPISTQSGEPANA